MKQKFGIQIVIWITVWLLFTASMLFFFPKNSDTVLTSDAANTDLTKQGTNQGDSEADPTELTTDWRDWEKPTVTVNPAKPQTEKTEKSEKPAVSPTPSEDVLVEIVAAYAKLYGKDAEKLSVRVEGKVWSGSVCYYAVFVDDADVEYEQRMSKETVLGYHFRYATTQPLLIYGKGKFYSVYDAFIVDDVIPTSDIGYLQKQYETNHPQLYEKGSRTRLLTKEIVSEYARRYGKNAEDLSVRYVAEVTKAQIEYYGVFVDDINTQYEETPCKETVKYQTFRYATGQQMLIYCDGQLYTLSEATAIADINFSELYQQYKAYYPALYDPLLVAAQNEAEIIEAYARQYGKDAEKLSVRIIYEDTWTNLEYFAVFVDDETQPYAAMPRLQRLGESLFSYPTAQPLLIYCQGSFSPIEEVYQHDYDMSMLNRYNLYYVWKEHSLLYPELYEESYLRKLAEQEIKALCTVRYGKGTAADYSVRFVTDYLNAFVVYIDGRYVNDPAVYRQQVGGLGFVYDDGKAMLVYCDGAIYTLPQALADHVIPYDTVKELYGICNPQLTEEIVAAHQALDDCDISSSHTVEYIAAVGGRYVIFFHCPNWMYHCMEWSQTVNGLKFRYSDGQSMDVYYNGHFYSIPDAFEKGILTPEQLRYIYEIYCGRYDYGSG